MGASFGKGIGKGLVLYYIALVHTRMKINLAMVLRRADWLTDAFSLLFCYLRLQLLPNGDISCWRIIRWSFPSKFPSSNGSVDCEAIVESVFVLLFVC